MCTFMVKETIQYYLHNGSNVHAALLDATKVCDRINLTRQSNILYISILLVAMVNTIILRKYNLSCSSTHKCTYATIYKTIVTTSSQLVDAHDSVCASIMDECIQIRDRSML